MVSGIARHYPKNSLIVINFFLTDFETELLDLAKAFNTTNKEFTATNALRVGCTYFRGHPFRTALRVCSPSRIELRSTSITRPVVTAGLLGREGFGTISGAIALCFMSAYALAPLLGARIWEWGGYDLMLKLACVIVLSGFAAYLLVLLSNRKTKN